MLTEHLGLDRLTELIEKSSLENIEVGQKWCNTVKWLLADFRWHGVVQIKPFIWLLGGSVN